jgi:hypothetical protein
VLLHNKELRHQTGRQTFFCFNSFIVVDLNCALGAAPQQGVPLLVGAPDFCLIYFNLFILIYFNSASGPAPQQGVATPDRAPAFFIIFIFLYFSLFYLCIRCRSIARSRAPDFFYDYYDFNLF